MFDIYFDKKYGKLCEYVEPGKVEVFEFESKHGLIKNMFIKKEIPMLVDNIKYYDIVTPYGYGGPIIYECNDKEKLVQEFSNTFSKYCFNNNIVCEFIRFHPIYKNYEDFKDVYETVYSRHTVGTNLKDYDDPFQSEFSKNLRKDVRNAIKKGVNAKIIYQPKDLSVFKELYEETMKRNDASDMYYFPDDYYRILENVLYQNILEIQLVYNDVAIASEIYFIKDKLMHAHLLGSRSKMLELNAGGLLEATAAKWGKENGFHYIHHGGGRSGDPNDSLYLYKKKFGRNTEFDFYIGKKIYLPEIYNKLVDMKKEILNKDYFPKYRG